MQARCSCWAPGAARPPLAAPPRLHARQSKRPQGWRPTCRAGADDAAAHQQLAPGAAEEVAKTGWDPEGLFAGAAPLAGSGGDLFARRQQQQQAAATSSTPPPAAPAAAAQPLPQPSSPRSDGASSSSGAGAPAPAAPGAPASFDPPLVPAPREGGVPAGQPDGSYDPAAFAEVLRQRYMPVDLSRPGARVLHLDPPILLFEGFAERELCEALMEAAGASDGLATSRIGAGNAGAAAAGAAAAAAAMSTSYDARRTSSSMLVDGGVRRQQPAIAAIMDELQRKGWELLCADGGKGWGGAGRMPAPGQYTYESPQVARYEAGQHFLAHEDAFPAPLARLIGFQRAATLLTYLNDAPGGGCTCFDHLGIAVAPRQGSALLFFPAFSDGRPDARTLHTAEAAGSVKWVTQQWVARGWGQPKKAAASKASGKAAAGGAASSGAGGQQVEVLTVPARVGAKVGGGGGGKGGNKRKGKGFGG